MFLEGSRGSERDELRWNKAANMSKGVDVESEREREWKFDLLGIMTPCKSDKRPDM